MSGLAFSVAPYNSSCVLVAIAQAVILVVCFTLRYVVEGE